MSVSNEIRHEGTQLIADIVRILRKYGSDDIADRFEQNFQEFGVDPVGVADCPLSLPTERGRFYTGFNSLDGKAAVEDNILYFRCIDRLSEILNEIRNTNGTKPWFRLGAKDDFFARLGAFGPGAEG